jgi:hypothetical protein
LFRDPERQKIAGVCAGLAHYVGMDITAMRAIWLGIFILEFSQQPFLQPCFPTLRNPLGGTSKSRNSSRFPENEGKAYELRQS